MKTPCSTTTPNPKFLLLGDSNVGVIGRAARAMGVPCAGGPLGAGRDFAVEFFAPVPGDIQLHDTEMEALYRQALAQAGVPALGALNVPLISTVGLSVHHLASAFNWQCYQTPEGDFDTGFLQGPLFKALIDALSAPALAFYEHALSMGLRVFAALPPQRIPGMADARVFKAAQQPLMERLAARGVRIIDVRAHTTGSDGLQLPRYCEADDPLHGNTAFGRLIVDSAIKYVTNQ